MKKDFELFQSEFRKWQKLFGLMGYKVYFKTEPLEKSFAEISVNPADLVVTVWLNSNLPDKDKPFKDVKQSAKHETIHLLIARLEHNGRYRYVSEGEITEATEELVHRLEVLIP